MARHETARWKFSYGWLRGEDWWGDPVSDNFVKMDMLLHPWVKSMTESTPPSGYAIGDMYIVATGGNGDWEGRDNDLAVATEFGWVFCTPMQKGIRVGSEAPAGWYFWKGDLFGWVEEGDVVDVPPAPQGTRYDVVMSIGYEAEPLEMFPLFTAPEDMTLPDAAPDSVGRCMSPPTSIVTIQLKRNPDSSEATDIIGTIRFIPGQIMAEINVTGNKLIPKGTHVVAQMPAEMPDNFRVYSATLRFILNN